MDAHTRARTASTATSSATATATNGSYRRRSNMGTSTAAHSTVDAARPDSHQLGGMRWHLAQRRVRCSSRQAGSKRASHACRSGSPGGLRRD